MEASICSHISNKEPREGPYCTLRKTSHNGCPPPRPGPIINFPRRGRNFVPAPRNGQETSAKPVGGTPPAHRIKEADAACHASQNRDSSLRCISNNALSLRKKLLTRGT